MSSCPSLAASYSPHLPWLGFYGFCPDSWAVQCDIPQMTHILPATFFIPQQSLTQPFTSCCESTTNGLEAGQSSWASQMGKPAGGVVLRPKCSSAQIRGPGNDCDISLHLRNLKFSRERTRNSTSEQFQIVRPRGHRKCMWVFRKGSLRRAG